MPKTLLINNGQRTIAIFNSSSIWAYPGHDRRVSLYPQLPWESWYQGHNCQNSYVDILIISKTSSIWLRCNFGLFPKSHFIKQPFNHFQLKAALIGALFLVDFMYGEKPKWLSKKCIYIFLPLKYIPFINWLSLNQITYKRNIDTRISIQTTTDISIKRSMIPTVCCRLDSKSTFAVFSCIRIRMAFPNQKRKETLFCWQSGLVREIFLAFAKRLGVTFDHQMQARHGRKGKDSKYQT